MADAQPGSRPAMHRIGQPSSNGPLKLQAPELTPDRSLRPLPGHSSAPTASATETINLTAPPLSLPEPPSLPNIQAKPWQAASEQDSAATPTKPSDDADAINEQCRRSMQLLLDLALAELPRSFSGDSHWQDTKKIWAGIKLRREGLKIETKRRWKERRHGLQVRYTVTSQRAIEQNAIDLNIVSVNAVGNEQDTDAPTAVDHWTINSRITAPLDFVARVEQWNYGARMYSIEIKGDMRVRLDIKGQLAIRPEFSGIIPGIEIDPNVDSAQLNLQHFHVDRVSKIGGEVAEQWGETAEWMAKRIFREDINNKLTEKLNRAIDKKRDDLLLSASDWIENLEHDSSTATR